MFTLGGASGNKKQTDNTATGLIMLAVSLIMDGATGAMEDKVLEETQWAKGEGTFDLMMFINLWVRNA